MPTLSEIRAQTQRLRETVGPQSNLRPMGAGEVFGRSALEQASLGYVKGGVDPVSASEHPVAQFSGSLTGGLAPLVPLTMAAGPVGAATGIGRAGAMVGLGAGLGFSRQTDEGIEGRLKNAAVEGALFTGFETARPIVQALKPSLTGLRRTGAEAGLIGAEATGIELAAGHPLDESLLSAGIMSTLHGVTGGLRRTPKPGEPPVSADAASAGQQVPRDALVSTPPIRGKGVDPGTPRLTPEEQFNPGGPGGTFGEMRQQLRQIESAERAMIEKAEGNRQRALETEAARLQGEEQRLASLAQRLEGNPRLISQIAEQELAAQNQLRQTGAKIANPERAALAKPFRSVEGGALAEQQGLRAFTGETVPRIFRETPRELPQDRRSPQSRPEVPVREEAPPQRPTAQPTELGNKGEPLPTSSSRSIIREEAVRPVAPKPVKESLPAKPEPARSLPAAVEPTKAPAEPASPNLRSKPKPTAKPNRLTKLGWKREESTGGHDESYRSPDNPQSRAVIDKVGDQWQGGTLSVREGIGEKWHVYPRRFSTRGAAMKYIADSDARDNPPAKSKPEPASPAAPSPAGAPASAQAARGGGAKEPKLIEVSDTDVTTPYNRIELYKGDKTIKGTITRRYKNAINISTRSGVVERVYYNEGWYVRPREQFVMTKEAISRAETAHERFNSVRGVEPPEWMSVSAAMDYVTVAYGEGGKLPRGITKKKIKDVLLDESGSTGEGVYRGSFANASTARSSSSGVGSFEQRYTTYSLSDVDRAVARAGAAKYGKPATISPASAKRSEGGKINRVEPSQGGVDRVSPLSEPAKAAASVEAKLVSVPAKDLKPGDIIAVTDYKNRGSWQVERITPAGQIKARRVGPEGPYGEIQRLPHKQKVSRYETNERKIRYRVDSTVEKKYPRLENAAEFIAALTEKPKSRNGDGSITLSGGLIPAEMGDAIARTIEKALKGTYKTLEAPIKRALMAAKVNEVSFPRRMADYVSGRWQKLTDGARAALARAHEWLRGKGFYEKITLQNRPGFVKVAGPKKARPDVEPVMSERRLRQVNRYAATQGVSITKLEAYAKEQGVKLEDASFVEARGWIDELSGKPGKLRMDPEIKKLHDEAQAAGVTHAELNDLIRKTFPGKSSHTQLRTPGERAAYEKMARSAIKAQKDRKRPAHLVVEDVKSGKQQVKEAPAKAARSAAKTYKRTVREPRANLKEVETGREGMERVDTATRTGRTLAHSLRNRWNEAVSSGLGLSREDRVWLRQNGKSYFESGGKHGQDGAAIPETVNRVQLEKLRVAWEEISSITKQIAEDLKVQGFRAVKGKYFPHWLTPEGRRALELREGDVFDALRKEAGVKGWDKKTEQEFFEGIGEGRFGSFENPRVADLPEFVMVNGRKIDILQTDPFKIVEHFIDRGSKRLGWIQEFGQGKKARLVLEGYGNQIAREGGADLGRMWTEVVNLEQGISASRGRGPLKQVAFGAQNVARAAQLSGATPTNAFLGTIPSALLFGVRRTMRNFVKSLGSTKEGRAEIGKLVGGMEISLSRMADTVEFAGWTGRFADKALRAVGFHWINRVLNETSMRSALEYFGEAAARGDRAKLMRLKEMGYRFTEAEIDGITKAGKLTYEQQMAIADHARSITNFTEMGALDRPVWMHKDTAKFFMTYMSPVIKLGDHFAFAIDEGFSKGNFKPLVTLIVGGTAGAMVNRQVKDWLKQKEREDESFPYKLYLGFMQSGSTGLLGEMLQRLYYLKKYDSPLIDVPTLEFYSDLFTQFPDVEKAVRKNTPALDAALQAVGVER